MLLKITLGAKIVQKKHVNEQTKKQPNICETTYSLNKLYGSHILTKPLDTYERRVEFNLEQRNLAGAAKTWSNT